MTYIIALLVFLAVALLAVSVLSFLAPEERRVSKRLVGLSTYETQQAMEAEPLLQPFRQRVIAPTAKGLADFVRHISPASYIEGLRTRVIRAGHPRGLHVEGLLAVKIILTVVLGVFVFVVSLFGGRPVGPALLLGIIFAVIGFMVPDVWLSSKVSARKLEIRRALPDMLDMLTISVEAGLGFDGAVAKLVTNSKGPLAREFARMLQDVQAGIPRQEALKNLSSRCDVPEVATFVTSMVQADVFGISVAKVLRTQAREMRVKRRQNAEEAAQKAPVKMVFPLVLCILPATLIVILGPAIVRIGIAFGIIG